MNAKPYASGAAKEEQKGFSETWDKAIIQISTGSSGGENNGNNLKRSHVHSPEMKTRQGAGFLNRTL